MTTDKADTKYILVVDDDPQLLALLVAVLAQPDRRIETAHNRIIAQVMVSRQLYDLVIDYIFLPDTRELELVDYLKEIDLDYRIILMSGYLADDFEDPESDDAVTRDRLLMLADRKGIAAVLGKPFASQRLHEAVNAALGE